MISIDEIKKYLPKYLTPEAEDNLFQSLEDFPDNMDEKMYLSEHVSHESIYQGDAFNNFPVINLPSLIVKEARVMVISNSCDMSSQNKRLYKKNVCYCPIIKLNKFKEKLLKVFEEQNVNSLIDRIKKQEVSAIFFLPKGCFLEEDSFIFFDKIISYPTESLPDNIMNERVFTLHDYGLYIFIFKLSVHFTRINEDKGRSENI